MKYSQDYKYRQASILDNHSDSNHYDNNHREESFIERRIKSLEHKVESLEKQLKLYEQMYNLKNLSSELTGEFDEEPIKEVFRRLAQLEEHYHQLSNQSYSLSKGNIDKMISDKYSQEKLKLNLKLNDISLKITDLAQFNERQQMRFATFQDTLIHIDKHLTNNNTKIKQLNSQILSIREMLNDNSKQEELFLRNITNLDTNNNDDL